MRSRMTESVSHMKNRWSRTDSRIAKLPSLLNTLQVNMSDFDFTSSHVYGKMRDGYLFQQRRRFWAHGCGPCPWRGLCDAQFLHLRPRDDTGRSSEEGPCPCCPGARKSGQYNHLEPRRSRQEFTSQRQPQNCTRLLADGTVSSRPT